MSTETLAVLQARMSSSRLPGKVMMEVNGRPMIYWQIQRILQAKRVNQLVVVTSTDSTDDVLTDFLEENSVIVFRGSLDDVLSRYMAVALRYKHQALIRLTGDCPLVMPKLIDRMVHSFYQQEVDYLSNTLAPTFPDGLDIEIIREGVLNKLTTFPLDPRELEHVTYGIYNRSEIFTLSNFQNESDESLSRWTVDYQEDLDFVRAIYQEFSGRETQFTYEDVCVLLERNPELTFRNQGYKRNERLQVGESDG